MGRKERGMHLVIILHCSNDTGQKSKGLAELFYELSQKNIQKFSFPQMKMIMKEVKVFKSRSEVDLIRIWKSYFFNLNA